MHVQRKDLSKTAYCTLCFCRQIILLILSQTNMFQFAINFLVKGSPKQDTVLQLEFHNTQQKGTAFFLLSAYMLEMQRSILLAFFAMGITLLACI